MLFRKKFTFKIVLFRKIFFFEIVLFKNARKTQTLRTLRGKLNQNVIFYVQFFFKICFFQLIFFSKSCFLQEKFSFKVMLFRKKFTFKNVLFRKKFFFEIVIFEKARKTQNLRNLRGKLNQNVIFVFKFFSKSAF